MDPLAQVLERERDVLETLLYRLDEAALVAADDRSRWWDRAARDVEDAATAARRTELMRAVTVLGAALELGLDPEVSLRSLAAAVDLPAREVLLDHREAMRALAAEIAAAVEHLRVAADEADTRHAVRRLHVACDLPSLRSFLR
jgi:hypothetical protein